MNRRRFLGLLAGAGAASATRYFLPPGRSDIEPRGATPVEIRERWEKLIHDAQHDSIALAIFDDPENQKRCAEVLGISGTPKTI